MMRDIHHHASRFAALEREGHVLAHDEAFGAWINEDARHKEAFEAEKSLVDAVHALPAAFLEELKQEVRKAPTPVNTPLVRRLVMPLVAACLVLVASVAFFWDVTTFSQTYVAGEKIGPAIVLPDNTKVSLDAGTQMEVAYYKTKRTVRLSRGKAIFEVASNPQSPFVVLMEGAQVRVLGTRFELINQDDFLSVSVLEGRVEVLKETKSLAVLGQGQRLWLDYRAQQGRVEAIDVSSVARWDEGKYAFTQASLRDVFGEFSKHLDIEVIFEKDYATLLPISGNFDVARFEDFLKVLPLIHPVRIEKNAHIVHVKQPSSKK